MANDNLTELYNSKYAHEVWCLPELKPFAVSTNAYDDIARILKGASGHLLEIGCGSGKFTMAIADQFERISAVDLSDVRINMAKNMLRSLCPEQETKISFITADVDKRLPFEDNEFDLIVACQVLEHVVDIFSALDECYRVCKPGGSIILSVPNLAYWKYAFGLLFDRHPLTGIPTRDIIEWRKGGWDGAHLHYFTKPCLDALLRNVGFIPVTWTGDGRWAKFRRWYHNFVGGLTVKANKSQITD